MVKVTTLMYPFIITRRTRHIYAATPVLADHCPRIITQIGKATNIVLQHVADDIIVTWTVVKNATSYEVAIYDDDSKLVNLDGDDLEQTVSAATATFDVTGIPHGDYHIFITAHTTSSLHFDGETESVTFPIAQTCSGHHFIVGVGYNGTVAPDYEDAVVTFPVNVEVLALFTGANTPDDLDGKNLEFFYRLYSSNSEDQNVWFAVADDADVNVVSYELGKDGDNNDILTVTINGLARHTQYDFFAAWENTVDLDIPTKDDPMRINGIRMIFRTYDDLAEANITGSMCTFPSRKMWLLL